MFRDRRWILHLLHPRWRHCHLCHLRHLLIHQLGENHLLGRILTCTALPSLSLLLLHLAMSRRIQTDTNLTTAVRSHKYVFNSSASVLSVMPICSTSCPCSRLFPKIDTSRCHTVLVHRQECRQTTAVLLTLKSDTQLMDSLRKLVLIPFHSRLRTGLG